MALDQGGACLDRSEYTGGGYTYIDLTNPANESADITQLDIWGLAASSTGVETGSFVDNTPPSYKCLAGHHCSGANMTIAAADDCSTRTSGGGDFTAYAASAGEYMGNYVASGNLERDATGGSGVYYVWGDQIYDNNIETFTLVASKVISVYGTGAAAGGISIPVVQHHRRRH